MLVSQSIFAPHPKVQVTLDAHCALKDYGLKNNGSESTPHFSESEICQWKWLTYFNFGADQALSLDQGLCQGVTLYFNQNMRKLIFLFCVWIVFFFISENCVQ